MATEREVFTSADDQHTQFELIRQAGPLELLTHLYHDLGIQSNILVCAEYSKHGQHLTKPRVLEALAKVINGQPALSIIGVNRPSETKEGSHRLWEVRLPSLRVQDCVEFISNEGDVDLSRIFENAHNQWFDTKDTTKPWWKLLVVNNRYAVFVYHHSIGDGLSGYAFHRSFLAALNADEHAAEMSVSMADNTFVIEQPAKSLTPSPFDYIDDKLSWVHVIYGFLFWVVLRFFVNQKYFLFSDAVFSKDYPTPVKPLSPKIKTRTRVQILRIEGGTMTGCLSECRKHNTSFTALLHTLIQVTLAVDIYPKAIFGFSRVAVNLRPLLKVDPGRDVFANAVSAYYRVQTLSKYRACAKKQSPHANPASSQGISVDAPRVWALAKAYKQHLTHATYKSGTVMQDFIVCKILEGDIEDVSFYGHGLYQNNSFLISNLGVFEPREDMVDGGWSIKDIGFSAGTIRAALGDFGIVFDVASVKGADCLISATYEQGVLKDEMVKEVLVALLARIKLLV
ncbi:Alcohol acetyltransferase [Hyaloscypha variabilis]